MRRGVPNTVLSHTVPRRFRGLWLHFENPVFVLREFTAWLEAANAADRDTPDADREQLDVDLRRLRRERAMLIAELIDLGDVIESPALQHGITTTLSAVGVTAVDSAGERFDPTRHRAVDRVPTSDPETAGQVAVTERLGYRDGERDTRLPDVLVYHFDAGGTR